MMKRTISGMTGTGSLAHNRRDFIAENVNQNRVYLNICYRDENLKDVYKELFDESVERYNVGKRNDRKITNYYDKIQHGKQEKLFHEVIFQIGNNKDMTAGTPEGDLAVKVLDEYMQDGDIVVNSTGTGTLGRVGFYRTSDNNIGLPIVPDSHVTVIRGVSSIHAFYLYAFMKANQRELEKKGEGSTNQKELKPLTLKEMLVPIPPFSEQKQIEIAVSEALSLIGTIEKSLS